MRQAHRSQVCVCFVVTHLLDDEVVVAAAQAAVSGEDDEEDLLGEGAKSIASRRESASRLFARNCGAVRLREGALRAREVQEALRAVQRPSGRQRPNRGQDARLGKRADLTGRTEDSGWSSTSSPARREFTA